MAILQVADFRGRFRLPSGVGSDLQIAIDQAERLVLEMFFAKRTADFILDDVMQAPATTLRSGVAGLPPFTELIISVAARIQFGVFTYQAQETAKDFDLQITLPLYFESLAKEYQYYTSLKNILRQVWQGSATVVNTSPFEVSLSPQALVWLRVGSPMSINSVVGEVSNILPTSVELTFTTPPVGIAAGDTVKYVIHYNINYIQQFEYA